MMMVPLRNLIIESWKIEGITPTEKEVSYLEGVFEEFLAQDALDVDMLTKFVETIQPKAVLRSKRGLDVRVGMYYPPKGGPEIKKELTKILTLANRGRVEEDVYKMYQVHHFYETLHPYTDGNGRSGRAIYLWMNDGYMVRHFLHEWYYRSLQFSNFRCPALDEER